MRAQAWRKIVGFTLLYVLFTTGQSWIPESGREVQIIGVDGMKLRGVYYEPSIQGPGVVLLHQCDRAGLATGYENLASILVDRGFHVLTLDFRGYGGSRNKEFTGENWQEAGRFFPTDTEAAYQFLISQPKVERGQIGVVGASCGGRQALLLAERHEEVRTLVLLSGSIRDTENALTKMSGRPILSVAGEEDSTAASAMKKVFERSQNPQSRFHLYKGGDHGTPLFARDRNLEGTIVDWFTDHLFH